MNSRSVEIKTITCPNCSSQKIKKYGTKKNKLQTFQRYFCKSCQKTFTLKTQLKNKTYPTNIILQVISLYNLGYTQTKISNIIAKKYKIKIPQRTISQWINESKQTTSFHRIRKESKKLYPPEQILEQHTFLHNNLPYKFQIHKAKLNLLFQNIKFNLHQKFLPIKDYLEKIPTKDFPHHIFKPHHMFKPEYSIKCNIEKEENKKQDKKEQTSRASQLKFSHLKITHISKNNLANKLASLALNLAKTNRDRHEAVQNFMLINDSTTIATEIPIYLTNDDLIYFLSKGFSINPKEYKTPITGHIDFLQIRNNFIHVLDYKPEANKINPIHQLTIYALALASRAKLAVKDFKCAWFDENNYYEFFPLHVVYKLRKIPKISKDQTKFNWKS